MRKKYNNCIISKFEKWHSLSSDNIVIRMVKGWNYFNNSGYIFLLFMKLLKLNLLSLIGYITNFAINSFSVIPAFNILKTDILA